MILCSCAVLRDGELKRAIAALFARDPYAVITPGRVYHALGRRLVCHGCMAVVTAAIAAEVAHHQQLIATPNPSEEEPSS